MRLHYLFSVGLLAGVALAGCTSKTNVEPEMPCGTYATVRLCYGMTTMCPTEHTTLELADGTRLRPSGPVWEAYLPHQAAGQVLSIGYTPGEALPTDEVGNVRAQLTCLEPAVIRCATPAPGGN